MQVFSLANVNVSIDNASIGSKLSLGGGGKNIGSIGYSFMNDIFSMNTSADGGATVSHNKSKAGTVSISIKQTSPYIRALEDYILQCRENPSQAAATITISDTTGNIQAVCSDCFPRNIPGNNVGDSPADRGFEFLCAEININNQ